MSPGDILGWALVAVGAVVAATTARPVVTAFGRAVRAGYCRQRDHARAVKGVRAACNWPDRRCTIPATYYTEVGPRCEVHIGLRRASHRGDRYAERIAYA